MKNFVCYVRSPQITQIDTKCKKIWVICVIYGSAFYKKAEKAIDISYYLIII